MSAKISMKQLAKECGCSIATVSYILNGKGSFGKEIRDKVLKAARKNNYTPNTAARNLRRGKTEIVGVVFYRPNADIFSSEFYLTLMKGFQRKLSEFGYDMILSEYTDAMAEKKQLPPFICNRKADGVVILGGFPKKNLKNLETTPIPTIMLDTYHNDYDSIITDGEKSTEGMMKILSEYGHSKVHYFAYATEDYNTDMRIKGFLNGVKKYAFKKNECILHRDFKTNAEACAILDKILTKKKTCPSVIMASNDNLAHSLMERSKSAGIKIPDDISFVGYDDTPVAIRSMPPLSTLRTDVEYLGELGALTILSRIKNPKAPVKATLLPSEPLIRDSLKKLRFL